MSLLQFYKNSDKKFDRKNPKIRENANEALRPPVQTRWLSIFTMARAFVDGREHLRQSIQENSPEDEIMLDMLLDEPALTAYLDVLDPINKMVFEMQVIFLILSAKAKIISIRPTSVQQLEKSFRTLLIFGGI